MRISDWSSDVCSSDLHQPHQCRIRAHGYIGHAAEIRPGAGQRCLSGVLGQWDLDAEGGAAGIARAGTQQPAWHIGELRSVAPAELPRIRSEEHTSELQSLMRISYAVFCLKKKKRTQTKDRNK